MRTRAFLTLLCLAPAVHAGIATNAPVRGIMDNSFLVEEAYNQEPGVVQHIFTAVPAVDRQPGPDDRLWDFAFTQEWPLFSQTHQVSYTVPYFHAESGGESAHGFGSTLLNYRWQALFNEETLLALAPRFSLALPTSQAEGGLDKLGYQGNLPFSVALNDRWYTHLNVGMTFLPDVGVTQKRDLKIYNFGASAIYAATERWHLMLEWIGLWEPSASGTASEREFASVLSPGVRHAINFKNDSQLVLGLAAPIGLNRAAADYGVFVYVSFEHYFQRRSH